MKEVGYLIFAFFFAVGRIFPVKRGKIVLFNGHNHGLNGNLEEIKKAMEQQEGSEKRYTFLLYAKRDLFHDHGIFGKCMDAFRFFVQWPVQMATAEKIFLNDNFLPLGYCKPAKGTQVIQLWHGAGAFKKFGLSTEKDENVRKQVVRANRRLTHLFVTSEQVVPYYQEAFGVPEEKIYAAGIPVTDLYFQKEQKVQSQERFYKKFPELTGKKLLLYTPTFRNTVEENSAILEHFSVERIHEVLGDEWVILIRMHPKFPSEHIVQNSFCYNMTDYSQIIDLYFVSDMLITDYSSTVVEYSLLDKPILLYAYDLEQYDRGFYRDYETTVPGDVAHNGQELLALLKNDGKKDVKRQNFVKLQYDYRDGDSAKRILAVLDQK